jgi:hypothetical protein
MKIDLEYAVKSDIRNNPIVRETDTRHGRELRRILLLGAVTVAMLVFSVWWHSQMDLIGYRIEDWKAARAQELSANRTLRLNLERLRSPQYLEPRARQLGLHEPTLAETVVIERAHTSRPAGTVLAMAR